jgi:FtsP/CotA-like multicopper oxidase with cupredoxin domain
MRFSVKSFLVFLLMWLGAAPTWASTCPIDNVATNPRIFQWEYHPVTATNPEPYYSGELEMDAATFNIGGDTLTTRVYRQVGTEFDIPAPTIVMQPGNKYVLRFRNSLPYEAPSSQHNVFRNPNVTNVHTHGLHISGESPSDDVTRMFEGGRGGDYVWDIPADHMGGTFWYHAHHHGSTLLQVSNGAFGLMIVDDSADNMPVNVAAMEEKHMIFGFLDPSSAGTGGDELVGGTLAPTWTLNGKRDANVCVPQDTWQHWRVLLADRDARLMDFEIGSDCEMALMARDGVWRTDAPKMLTGNDISLTGASRADIAVRCSADSTISIGGQVEAQIFVDGPSDPTPHPFAEDGVSTWQAKRPVYLRDLKSEPVAGTESVRMGARTINGEKFNKNEPTLTADANGVQKWSLKGALNHPFHLHIYHVQMDGACDSFEDGEFYDVVAGNCDIRFDLDAQKSSVFEGRTIMHCHILEHEDQGAMGWLQVNGGMPAPTFPVDAGVSQAFAEYYILDGGGPVNQPPSSDFAFNCTDLNCSFTDLSIDDTGITSWAWDFGDGNVSSVQNPLHDFAAAGIYSVSLTVEDGDGLSANSTQDVTVSEVPISNISLSASGSKIKGLIVNDLAWSGAETADVDIYLNGNGLTTIANSGAFTHETGQRGGGTFTYQVCEAGTLTCSNSVNISF